MDYFDQVAEEWDDLRAGYFDERVREAAIEEAGLSPEMVVADVGTGTGFMIQGLAPLMRKVYGFDASAEMLKVAARKLEGFNNVELHQADGLSLPLEDESLDAIFANMYLHHIPEPPLALKEMARLLKRGGKLILTDLDQHDQEWMREEMADFWLGFDRIQIDNWLREAGFEEVAIECAPTSCCTDSPEGEKVSITIFIARGMKAE
ncbi:MAG: class I SAM-dependent methyltransferase [Anaerolineae bacterium]|nr:class I SAM-dependent methyltransferase [Anaerolineae bacterium]